jgi:hypothetical protein
MVRKEGEGRSWVVRRSLVLQKVLSGLNRVDTISADPDERGAIFVKEKPPWWAICVVTFPASSGDLLGRGGGVDPHEWKLLCSGAQCQGLAASVPR